MTCLPLGIVFNEEDFSECSDLGGLGRHPQVLKKLCKAYSPLMLKEWDDLPGTTKTNPPSDAKRMG